MPLYYTDLTKEEIADVEADIKKADPENNAELTSALSILTGEKIPPAIGLTLYQQIHPDLVFKLLSDLYKEHIRPLAIQRYRLYQEKEALQEQIKAENNGSNTDSYWTKWRIASLQQNVEALNKKINLYSGLIECHCFSLQDAQTVVIKKLNENKEIAERIESRMRGEAVNSDHASDTTLLEKNHTAVRCISKDLFHNFCAASQLYLGGISHVKSAYAPTNYRPPSKRLSQSLYSQSGNIAELFSFEVSRGCQLPEWQDIPDISKINKAKWKTLEPNQPVSDLGNIRDWFGQSIKMTLGLLGGWFIRPFIKFFIPKASTSKQPFYYSHSQHQIALSIERLTPRFTQYDKEHYKKRNFYHEYHGPFSGELKEIPNFSYSSLEEEKNNAVPGFSTAVEVFSRGYAIDSTNFFSTHGGKKSIDVCKEIIAQATPSNTEENFKTLKTVSDFLRDGQSGMHYLSLKSRLTSSILDSSTPALQPIQFAIEGRNRRVYADNELKERPFYKRYCPVFFSEERRNNRIEAKRIADALDDYTRKISPAGG